MLSVVKIQNVVGYSYSIGDNHKEQIPFGSRNKFLVSVISEAPDSFSKAPKMRDNTSLLPLYARMQKNKQDAEELQNIIDDYRASLNKSNLLLNRLEIERQQRISQSKIYSVEQKRQEYIKKITELENRFQKKTQTQVVKHFSEVESKYNSTEHVTKRLRNKYFRLKKAMQAPQEQKINQELEKLKTEYAQFCQIHPTVRIDVGIANLDSLIGVTKNTRDNLIAKINGAEKRLKSIKNENLSLFKKYGPLVDKSRRQAEESGFGQNIELNVDELLIKPKEKKKAKHSKVSSKAGNLINKKAWTEMKLTPEQKARQDELKDILAVKESELNDLIKKRNDALLKINGRTSIKTGSEAKAETKFFAEKLEKIRKSAKGDQVKIKQFTNDFITKHREKQEKVYPKGLAEQVEELEQQLEGASIEDKLIIEEKIALLEKKISLQLKKINSINAKIKLITDATLPTKREADQLKLGLVS